MKFRVGNIVVVKDNVPWNYSVIKRFVVIGRSPLYINIDFLPGDKEMNDVLEKLDGISGIPYGKLLGMRGYSFDEKRFELESVGLYKAKKKKEKGKNYEKETKERKSKNRRLPVLSSE